MKTSQMAAMTTVSAAFTAAKCTPRAVARSAKGPAAALRAPARPIAATVGNRARLAKISRSAAPRSRVVVRAQTPSWHPDANPADEDPDAPTPGFASIDEAIAEVAAGRFVVVLDDEDRENEGDLIGAADKMTQESMHFMIRHTSGLVCVAVDDETALAEGEWFCEACKAARDGKRDPREPLNCAICEHGREGGTEAVRCLPLAFRRATTRPVSEADALHEEDPSGAWSDCWAHVACAAWIGEAGFTGSNGSGTVLVGELNRERSSLRCQFCGERGQAVQCQHKTCRAAFHPTCILRELMGPKPWSTKYDPEHPGAFFRSPGYVTHIEHMYCGAHCDKFFDKKPKKVEKSEYEQSRDSKIAQNQAFLRSMGLGGADVGPPKKKSKPRPRKKEQQEPTRQSARLAGKDKQLSNSMGKLREVGPVPRLKLRPNLQSVWNCIKSARSVQKDLECTVTRIEARRWLSLPH